MWLARQALPWDLADSRVLGAVESGTRLELAALVVSQDRGTLALLDEWGLFESEFTPGSSILGEAELVLVEGCVDVRHGPAVLKGARVSGWHPGGRETRRGGLNRWAHKDARCSVSPLRKCHSVLAAG